MVRGLVLLVARGSFTRGRRFRSGAHLRARRPSGNHLPPNLGVPGTRLSRAKSLRASARRTARRWFRNPGRRGWHADRVHGNLGQRQAGDRHPRRIRRASGPFPAGRRPPGRPSPPEPPVTAAATIFWAALRRWRRSRSRKRCRRADSRARSGTTALPPKKAAAAKSTCCTPDSSATSMWCSPGIRATPTA